MTRRQVIGTAAVIALLGAVVIVAEGLAKFAGGCLLVGFGIFVVSLEGKQLDESGIRPTEQALAERQRALNEDLSGIRERGFPWKY